MYFIINTMLGSHVGVSHSLTYRDGNGSHLGRILMDPDPFIFLDLNPDPLTDLLGLKRWDWDLYLDFVDLIHKSLVYSHHFSN